MLSARKSPPGGRVLVGPPAGEGVASVGLTLVSDEVVVEGGGDTGIKLDLKKAAMSGGEAEPTERGGDTPSLGR